VNLKNLLNTDSQGVDVWTKGQVSLLNDVYENHITTSAIDSTNNKPEQHLRSIRYNNTDGVLLHDGYDVDKHYQPITASISNKARTTTVATLTTSAVHSFVVGMEVDISGVGSPFDGTFTITTVPTTTTFTYTTATSGTIASTAVSPVGSASSTITHFVDYISGTDRKVFAICDDGTYAYWVTNKTQGGNQRVTMFKKPLTGNAATGSSNPSATGDVTQMFQSGDTEIIDGCMEYVKDRIVLTVNNKVYEVAPNATALPTPVYTNPVTTYIYTSITASGPAIYTSGHNGIVSTIQKYTLSNTSGSMPVLTSAIVSAEFPPGEIVYKIYYYLGYMLIGTNKGIRVIRARGSFTNGAMDIATIDSSNNTYAIITYNSSIGTPEAATNSPDGPQEFISYKFTLSRSASNTSLGPTFKGFQAKSLPATKRQRLIQFPVWCYDVETDRYNVLAGYEGRAWERIQKLEDIEAAGDIINVQDFTTGERVQALVEKISFIRKTPPSARYDGFGGLLTITVRTVL
jgi:hypothetical protein